MEKDALAGSMNCVEIGDCRAILPTLDAGVFQCCITSPPYWGLRDYGHPGQLGLEATPDLYVAHMVEVFREVRRVLSDDGVLWLNLGDSYATNRTYQVPSTKGGPEHAPAQGFVGSVSGLKSKDLVGIPWRVAFALQADGWYLRSDVIWSKSNQMPESVTDRPTGAHEYVFLMSKSESYFYDSEAAREPSVAPGDRIVTIDEKTLPGGKHGLAGARASGVVRLGGGETRNLRSVWTIPTQPYTGSHFAVMPQKLVSRCVLVGSHVGDAILDPFMGSGTVGLVAESLGRRWFGCELNPEYGKLISKRTAQIGLGI